MKTNDSIGIRLVVSCAILAGLISPAARAQQQAGKFDYQEITLDNGLKVISLEDFSCPIVAVHLWYHVGSKDENPERQGFAHMFEHMMFRGTDRLGSTDHFDFIRKTGGTCNAYTTFDQTVYTQTLPANQLNMAFWLEAERMSMLKIDQEAFDTERKVVEEERRMGVNQPYGKVMEKSLPHIFPDHPYSWSTIGSIPHLRSATVKELREFWTRYYVPNNATLIVVGAVKHAEVQQLAKRNFGWIPRCEDPPRISMPEWQPLTAKPVTITEKNAPAPLVALVFRGVPRSHPDKTAIDLMTTILGGGESSRLYRRIVADDESGVMALAGAMSLEQDGVIGAAAILSPIGGNPAEATDSLKDEVQRLQSDVVSEAELTKAKNQLLKQLVTESLTVQSKASALGSAAVLEGDVSRINTRLDRIRAVTQDDIQRVAKKYLALDQAITGKVNRNLLGTLGSIFGIKDDEEKAPITGEKETSPPPPGRPGISRPADRIAEVPLAGLLNYDSTPEYDEVTFENGMRVIVVENDEVPYVSVQLGFRAGAWTESKPGAASMAMSMLSKGSANHTEAELSEELETYAISLSGSASMDSSSARLGCLPEHIDRGVRLLSEVVTTPTMPADEYKKLKRQTRTGMVISSRTPTYLADRELRQRLFGDHPYARTAAGELEDLAELERDDVLAWYQKHIRSDQATLIFSGAIDLETAGNLARKYFAQWMPQEEYVPVQVTDPPPKRATHIYLVDNPGIQSQIRIGQLGFTRKDPDYFTSRVVGGYFGGAFSSRLNETIRVEKGLTYGARGGFRASRMSGRFVVSTFSKNASTVEAIEAILAEVKRLQQEPPTESELQDTVSYIVGSYPADRETPQQVASDLWFLQEMELADDYFKKLLSGVSSTTADHCLRLAGAKIEPDKLIIVVVGPAKKLQAGLEEIAPVTVVGQRDEKADAA